MDLGILQWLQENHIKNEKGDLIEFDRHPFLIDIYDDQSQKLCVMKAAQVGLSTLEFIKLFYDSMRYKMDIIYTMPTDNDVRVMVGGKFNRIIANNPCMLKLVRDKDSIEQKQTGNSMIYFRGSWTKKSAISVTADRLCHDEKDASRLDIIADFQARLQHSKFKQTHTFSHPSLPEVGVHLDWLKSDQKQWMIKCPHCNHWQTLSWDLDDPSNMSIDITKGIYICKRCRRELEDWVRIAGEWVPTYKDKEWSGYLVSLLMAPWMSAKDIIDKFQNKDTTDEFFCTKILGLPYADESSKLLRESFFQNLTNKLYAPDSDERVIIGIDTGLKLDYVLGNQYGLFYHGECKDYAELDQLMKRYPRAVAVIDSGGDLIGSRQFFEKWTGRVYLCALTGDRNSKELVTWKKGDESGFCTADRNRMIQLVIDEFRKKRIPVHGTEDDWYSYWEDWNNLSKMKVLDPDTKVVKGYKWVRSGRDHRCFVEGTKILTSNGNKNIENIQIGDRVLTRKGFKKVVWLDNHLEEVIDTGLLVGTKNHPIWTKQNNFKDLQAIVFSDIILVCNQKKLFIKILNFVDILIQRIERKEFILSQTGERKQKELVGYTKKFTKTILELYRKVLLFITKIIIRLITRQKTWRQYQEQTIQENILSNGIQKKKTKKQTENILKRYCHWLTRNLQNGLKLKKVKGYYEKTLTRLRDLFVKFVVMRQQQYQETEGSFAVKNATTNFIMPNGGKSIQNINSLKQNAQYAEKNLIEINIGEEKLVQKNAPTNKLAGQKKVYNFEVEDCHEYFANGVLVSNCMATVFWRVGMMRFAGMGKIIEIDDGLPPANSYNIIGEKAQITADQLFNIEGSLDQLEDNEVDW